jgi:zinc transporter
MPSPLSQGRSSQSLPAYSGNKPPDTELRVRCAYILTAPTPRQLSLDEVLRWESRQGPLWVHLDHGQLIPKWLKEHHSIDDAVLQLLVDEARRPRVDVVNHDNLVMVFRTASGEAGPTADLTLNTRVWLSPTRALTMSEGRQDVFDDSAHQIETGRGPQTIPQFLVQLMDNVVKRGELGVLQIDADLTDIELDQERGEAVEAERLRAVRRRAMQLRRSIFPYREVLVQLNRLQLLWLHDHIHERWDPMVEDAAGIVEEVDGILDRARLVQESIGERLALQLNQRVYVLTLISGIMLPLTFLTGLLGVNLAGIPGAHSPWSFPSFCILLTVIGICQYFLFKKLRWWG